MSFPVAVQVKIELEGEIARLNRNPRLRDKRGPFRQQVKKRGRDTRVAYVVDRRGHRVKEVREIEYSALAP